MNRTPARRVSVVAAIMVGAGGLLSGILGYLFLLWGVPNVPRLFILQDPIGFALRPNALPLAVVAMLLALVVVIGLTWLFVRLVVRGALPGRGSAVFFGTWGAVVVASCIAGLVRAPLAVAALGIPAEQSEILMIQTFQAVTASASWGLTWGWLTALVAALIHRSAPAAVATGYGAPGDGSTYSAPDATTYPPQQTSADATYQPPHAG